MAKHTKISELPVFDIADYLDSDEAIAEYLNQVIAEGDADELTEALGAVARAKGMTQIAAGSGLTREGLYKALRAGSKPRFDTVARVVNSLGMRLQVSV